MPGTASARGLADPFDPEQAIPKAAGLLAELKGQFGNWGLAAAAYNAGTRDGSQRYVKGEADLPGETQDYVSIVTGHSADEWRGADAAKLTDEAVFPGSSCGADRRQIPHHAADPVRPLLVLGAVGGADFRGVQQGGGAASI